MQIELSGKSHLFYSADGILLQGSFIVRVCSNQRHRHLPSLAEAMERLMPNCDASCFMTILKVTSLSCLTPLFKVRGNTGCETVIHTK